MSCARPNVNRTAIFAAGLIVAAALTRGAEPASDTVRLTAHLKILRGKSSLNSEEYGGVRSEYLNWIDARVKTGATVEEMNLELRTAGLLFRWPDSEDEYSRSHAGYLEPIAVRAVRGAAELFAIKAAIYKGIGCNLDTPVAVYEKAPLLRIGLLQADENDPAPAYHLSGLDAARRPATGGWLIASGWTISNCTSTWNGKRVRIDILNGSLARNLLAKDLNAQDRDRAEDVSVWVQNGLVTFWYEGAISDSDLLSAHSVMRYRVAGDLAVRETPLALTRAGFLQEWLKADGDIAARWSESDASGVHQTVAAAFEHNTFTWDRISRCEGTPSVWEVGVRLDDSKAQYVFRIAGARATELRMQSVATQAAASCVPVDLRKNLASIGGELPW